MGAPKQRWTDEEEQALRAGVLKHGPGKWRTILTDPQFSFILRLRSNVDLKDKWRNINVMANGSGSRSKARLAIKKFQASPRLEKNSMVLIEDAKPLAVSGGTLQTSSSNKLIARLDKFITEAIWKLGEPTGSGKAEIAKCIQEQYASPSNFKKLLSSKLKEMTAKGELIKEKRQYRIAAGSSTPGGRSNPPPLLLEGRQRDSSRIEKNNISLLSKSQIDEELSKMRSMTAHEAAEAAARAIVDAEVAIAEAEKAAKEAEIAEAEAEEARVFAEAAMKALKLRTCVASW